jgi:hypothetical protein
MKRIVYIGHGRSSLWNELLPLVRMKGFEHDEFNASPPAGQTAVQRLERMLQRASYALLVLTAEDEHEDGSVHPRGNVIHEAGLFQGRLGFQRAVMLVEDGCSTFSNVAGLQIIRFSKGNIHSASGDIRRLLEHWRENAAEAAEGLLQQPTGQVLPRAFSKGRFSIALVLCAFALTAAIFAAANTLLSRLGRPWHAISAIPTLFATFAYSSWLTNR